MSHFFLKRSLAGMGVLFFLFALNVEARVTINEPIDSAVYDKVDLLRANGLIKSQIVGIRPYSRLELARMIDEAQKNQGLLKGNETFRLFIQETLDDLEKHFSREVKMLNEKQQVNHFYIKPVEKVGVELVVTNEGYRPVPVNNGLGPIQAKYNPLYFNQGGRDYIDGAQYGLTDRNWVELTGYSSLSFASRVQFEFPHVEAVDQDQFFIDELQANFGIRNVRLSAGRGPLLLGQSSYGGFILSSNVRALDQIILTHDHPFRFPWIFKYLGDQKMIAYFATLGPESFFKNTILSGYKWMMKPHANLEIGLSNVMQIGGDGAPDFGFVDFISDFGGFSGTSHSVSNRILGFDSRLRLPLLNGLEIYGEAFWDDKTFSSLKRTLIDTSAYKFGVFIPKITRNGRLSATFETKFISELFYRHGQFKSGYTLNNEILGDAWGPDSFGFNLDMKYIMNQTTTLDGGLSFISTDSNTYFNSGNSITVLANNKKDTHMIIESGVVKKFALCNLDTHLSYDHVTNAGYGPSSNNNVKFSFELSRNW